MGSCVARRAMDRRSQCQRLAGRRRKPNQGILHLWQSSRGWFSKFAVAGVLGLLATIGFPLVSASTTASAASCDYQPGTYWHAFTDSYYPGGVDGIYVESEEFSGNSPYVCGYTHSHTVESIVMYLQKSGDYVEMGYVEGYVTNGNGGQVYKLCCGLYYFTYTDIFSAGTSVLDIPGPVANQTHGNGIQLLVKGCPSACQLYAHYWTDTTSWPNEDINTPQDNPANTVLTNGEVMTDDTDQMGTNEFSHPEIHAGQWSYWTNYSLQAADQPYCNYDVSVGPDGGEYYFENEGPKLPC